MPPGRSRRPHWLIALPVLLVLAVAASLGVRAWIEAFLRGDDFRHFLDRKSSAVLRADGRFAPLRWQDAEVYSDAFEAAGGPGPWEKLTVEEVRARLDLAAVWRRVWRVERIDAEKLSASLRAPSLAAPDAAAASAVKPAAGGQDFFARFLPSRVEIGDFRVNNLTLSWASGRLAGARIAAHPSDSTMQAWELEGTGGRLEEARLPAIALASFNVKASAHDVFLTRAEGRADSGGRLELSGRQALGGDRAMDLSVDYDGLPAGEFLPEDWRARLHGNTAGSVRVTGSGADAQTLRARGHIDLNDGRLAALPVLDELAVLTASGRYRQIPLQKGHADFDWTPQGVAVTNLSVESEGLLRLEGGFTVRGDQIDGTIQVGVARGSLRWIQPVSARVFDLPERDGYVWTTAHLHGPARHPAEDLTPRLIAAAQQEVIEKAKQGAGTVLDTASGLLDLLKGP